jgi:hypothetical protein
VRLLPLLALLLAGCTYARVPQKPATDGTALPPATFYGVGMNLDIPTDPPVKMVVDAHAADVAGSVIQSAGSGVINHGIDKAAEAQKP